MALDLDKIEGKIDRAVTATTEVSMTLGGVQVKDMGELLELAKLMSLSGPAVPYHLRGQPGTCLAVCIRALRFGFDPFTLAEHCYTMKKSQKTDDGRWTDVETVAYDSFVIRAIIGAHAQLTGILRYTFEGEGDDRRCTVTATPKGESKALEHTSERLGDLIAARGRNDKGQIKGSPLWDTNPDQQMAYATGRDFCRRYFPQILLGWYDKEEFDENVAPERPVAQVKTSGLRDRLSKPKEPQRGFDQDTINKTIDGEVAKRDVTPKETASAPAKAQAAPEIQTPPPVVEDTGAAEQIPVENPSAPPAGEDESPPPEDGEVLSPLASPSEESKPAIKPAVYTPPAPPMTGGDYLRYVGEMLATPGMDIAKDVREWWGSPYETKIRDSLPDLKMETRKAAKVLITDHLDMLKKG